MEILGSISQKRPYLIERVFFQGLPLILTLRKPFLPSRKALLLQELPGDALCLSKQSALGALVMRIGFLV